MDQDGTNLHRLTDHAERDDYAAWQPNGVQLAAICERGGKHDLYLIPVTRPQP